MTAVLTQIGASAGEFITFKVVVTSKVGEGERENSVMQLT
jgi:hypothetical protein